MTEKLVWCEESGLRRIPREDDRNIGKCKQTKATNCHAHLDPILLNIKTKQNIIFCLNAWKCIEQNINGGGVELHMVFIAIFFLIH